MAHGHAYLFLFVFRRGNKISSTHVCCYKPRLLFENIHFSTLLLFGTNWPFRGDSYGCGISVASGHRGHMALPVQCVRPQSLHLAKRECVAEPEAVLGLPSAYLALGKRGSVLCSVRAASGFTCRPTGSRGPSSPSQTPPQIWRHHPRCHPLVGS